MQWTAKITEPLTKNTSSLFLFKINECPAAHNCKRLVRHMYTHVYGLEQSRQKCSSWKSCHWGSVLVLQEVLSNNVKKTTAVLKLKGGHTKYWFDSIIHSQFYSFTAFCHLMKIKVSKLLFWKQLLHSTVNTSYCMYQYFLIIFIYTTQNYKALYTVVHTKSFVTLPGLLFYCMLVTLYCFKLQNECRY